MKLAVATVLVAATLGCIDVSTLQSRPPKMDAGGPQDVGDGATDGGAAVCASCSPMGCASPADDNPNLVAGLESGCNDPETRNGRSTYWFTFANGLSTISPFPMTSFIPACLGANGSCYAACANGLLAGNSYPYAGLGVAFGPLSAYDLSAYAGVSFYVLGTIAPDSRLRFAVSTVADASVGSGGTCTGAIACNDAYQLDVPGFEPGFPHTNWTKVVVTFDMLRQVGFGPAEAWDPAHALSLVWSVYSPPETVLTDQDYSVCIDQIELIPR
jgi:hypothetical protein